MKFTPKTEDELKAENLCPEGKYPFTVLECREKASKSENNPGKLMLEIKLNVHGDDSWDYHVYDYVADWFMGYKLRHFLYSIGRGADYDAGTTNPESYVGLQGWAEISIQKGKGKYGPKNAISDYVVENATAKASDTTVKTEKPADAGEADDVPF